MKTLLKTVTNVAIIFLFVSCAQVATKMTSTAKSPEVDGPSKDARDFAADFNRKKGVTNF